MTLPPCLRSIVNGFRRRDDLDDIPARMWRSALDFDGMSVDPVVAARGVGVHVFTASLPAAEQGRLVLSPTYEGVNILINDTSPLAVQRLTCAQLLGVHAGIDPLGIDAEPVIIGPRGMDIGPDHDGFGWSFAGRLLMPRQLVRDVSQVSGSGMEVAKRMRVPFDFAVGRMRRLGIGVPALA